MNYKTYNKEDGYSYTFGAFPTYEILTQKPQNVIEIITHEKLEKSSDIDKILSIANKNGIKISTNGKLLEKLSKKGNIYIMAVFRKYKDTLQNNQNHILLNNPSDMGNLGTIIRGMLGFGYENLALITPCIDHFDPRVIRASMGSIFSVNIETFSSVEEYLNKYNNYTYPFMLKASTNLQDLKEKKNPHTLIFGNEATGLPDRFLDMGTPLLIKQSPKIDSFNLSVSVTIACYEFSK
ncbi:MAG: TrmH family RNA methyltransferase [Clostridiales bacterium]|nr:TrmH family RNA methyltransferase [Clostridiales bacterium]